MKSVAKIFLGFSLIALAACSGKGEGGSRINNIDNDGNDSPTPSVIDDDDTPAGPTGSIIACTDALGSYCAETTDMSLKSECDESNGDKLLDKCPAGGKKCNISGAQNITFYVYEGQMTCEMLQLFMSMGDDED